MSFKLPDFFEYGGLSSADFGLYLTQRPNFPIPERVVETHEIPGRNGALHIDCGNYRDVELELDCMFVGDTAQASAIADWINSGHGQPLPLRLTGYPGIFFEAVPVGGVSIRYLLFNFHRFTLKFRARPQKFLDSGEKPVVFVIPDEFPDPEPYISLDIFNPGTEIAYPKIRLVAKVEAPVTVRVSMVAAGAASESEVVLNGIDGYVDIDAEIGEAYKGGESRNSIVGYSPARPNKLEPLKLLPGMNFIGLKFQPSYAVPPISRVEITGRWWTI